ncbi:DUF6555 family protein [Pseudomonas violetae]|jgi:hypothetical protein|uniref:Uncharacterized protein n=1 Tax=Pseudomonas violetae TaxID=2915813 RepID=A0ABT0F435_9PSED|nr:DUF6555 family protein [Pseudomonas violetae]MCK1792751.1 hypothetical protein [Pseudomonas violetae]
MRALHFQITYRLNDARQVFVQPDSHMTDADAWYYACLHAGVGLAYGEDPDQQGLAKLRTQAQLCGLTDVRWEALP